jgi:hypothetical protein
MVSRYRFASLSPYDLLPTCKGEKDVKIARDGYFERITGISGLGLFVVGCAWVVGTYIYVVPKMHT